MQVLRFLYVSSFRPIARSTIYTQFIRTGFSLLARPSFQSVHRKRPTLFTVSASMSTKASDVMEGDRAGGNLPTKKVKTEAVVVEQEGKEKRVKKEAKEVEITGNLDKKRRNLKGKERSGRNGKEDEERGEKGSCRKGGKEWQRRREKEGCGE
eukprot:comp22604_c0_seq1/m.34677 comp22604_c0_seq1/g.34677  ORF comp22604_c0_seq1/g.34677 comp22604_c0_seq1/m.34677 type:complete len:153 (-) comp22604_c0_seq1:1542-2000(-)